MNHIIQILIYIHAFFGGLGLITGIIPVLVKKGGKTHKKSGKIFSYSMIISALISLIIARMPGHENLFLFLIGIFTIYMVLAGNRALTLKGEIKTKADRIDKAISGSMFVASLVMIGVGITNLFQHTDGGVLYVFFGGLGLMMTLQDFKTFRTFATHKNAWIKSHLGRMLGALIASITAFLITGLHLRSLIVWILPTLIGSLYIIYWNRRLSSIPRQKTSKGGLFKNAGE